MRKLAKMNRAGPRAAWVRLPATLGILGALLAWESLHGADEPRAVARQADIARLIEQLGSDEYVTRHRSEKALIRLGFEAFDALKEAENHIDLEIAARASYLAQLVEVEWIRDDDSPKVAARLKHYAEMSEDDRRGAIEKLAALRNDEGLEALCRIVRFEKSQFLSKRAALEILRPKLLPEGRLEDRSQVISETIGRSRRPAAGWLHVYTRSLEDPNAGAEIWDKVIEEEQVTVDKLSNAVQDDIMARLLYTIAQIHSVQARDERAEELALRAFKMRLGDPVSHYLLAAMLHLRGLADWAEREYRYVIDLGPEGAGTVQGASDRLSLMLHDRESSLAAADVLQRVVKSLGKTASPMLHARMEYYYAEHFAKAGDLAKQREHLDRAVRHDPTDADVLIAMYRLPDVDKTYRDKTRALINVTAGKIERVIKQNPRSAMPYNQWAWLISNTEGDFDKAIRYSRKSLELKPNSASYLDTLGRCYYAQGDFDGAIKHQQQAADLEPHTQMIARQLDLFQKALAESKRNKK